MKNTFFNKSIEFSLIRKRILEVEKARVGFYSVGLYPASLAYNCAMQTDGKDLLLATRPGRELLGAFPPSSMEGMDLDHVETVLSMGKHREGNEFFQNSLSDLILRCELVVLSANSNHIEQDLKEAIALRKALNRNDVVLACLAGSFCYDSQFNDSYILCQKEPNLGFFSGFHRHDALRNPVDSFTANFCHPDAMTAMLGARMLGRLSPNIQVSAGVHNIEGQYIKAAKNISSIFAGFGYSFHGSNPGLLPTLLTLLLEQCLDQAASVSMSRKDRDALYSRQPFPLTELGYGVQRIEAALVRDGDLKMVRDHTFAQLTAMVADVRGSMMPPIVGKPTRNFQAGQILAEKMKELERCPYNMEELFEWCESSSLSRGGLEGLKSLEYWPQIINTYAIPLNDSSMLNLLYMSIYGNEENKSIAYSVMTQSRELTNYCQESVRPSHSRRYAEAFNSLDLPESMELLVNSVISENSRNASFTRSSEHCPPLDSKLPAYIKAMNFIEDSFKLK